MGEKILITFDDLLDFPELCQKSKNLTYSKHKPEMRSIVSQCHAWDEFTQILGSQSPSSDTIWIQNCESEFDIQASILLASYGYYRQAISLLRLWLENGLYALYYEDHEIEFAWLSLDVKAPKGLRISFSKDLLDYLFKFETFENYNDNLKPYCKREKDWAVKNFRSWIEIIYDELSAHIHGRGIHRSNLLTLSFPKGEMQTYNKKYFISWYEMFNSIFQILIVANLLYNPKLFNRHRAKRKLILEHIHDNTLEALRKTISINY